MHAILIPSIMKRKSDKYAKNGEEIMDILVDDIDRYQQLSNQEELLALASALAGNGAVLEVVHTKLNCAFAIK
jgi:hypothetical protein